MRESKWRGQNSRRLGNGKFIHRRQKKGSSNFNTLQNSDQTSNSKNVYYDGNRSESSRGSRGGSNNPFSNNGNNNNFVNDNSRMQTQGFCKFVDTSSNNGYRRNENNRNFRDNVNVNEEYKKYRNEYFNSYKSKKPLLGYNDFEQTFYKNRVDDENTNATSNFQQIEETQDNQNNNTNTDQPVILPVPKVKIKQEKLEEEKQKINQKNKSRDDTENDSSSSNDETVKNIKKSISAVVNSTEKPLINMTNTSTQIKTIKPKIKKEKDNSKQGSSSEESSSSAESSSSESKDSIKLKSKKDKDRTVFKNVSKAKSEDAEVICLGKLETFENLIEDEIVSSEKPECLLCDEDGHSSFFCKMMCKNCGDKYHNSTMCLKPPNLSRMLQMYMEFTMNQCYQYDPEKRFSYRNGNTQTELLPGFTPPMLPNPTKLTTSEFNIFSNEFHNECEKRKRGSSGILNTSKSKRIHKSSESSCSSSCSSITTSTKKRKKVTKKNVQDISTNQHLMPMQFNPFMAAALSQMMGFNPNMATNFSNSLVKKER